ncbi:glucose 1-dehydrogenase [Streptomyces sp. DSM 44915]|uniref:Glucose 1-dehydrogenase n=1 Tax=Streptomyces chisholmiae TaxID=3075540 RepID=A0ABU2JX83_9ACTN|nr:glucose 1-dehydrogenase [Streptomyces sp. DSM 44915]MDT0268838.1 glucose 1-dehydrogenase [Streptomyces sp. DSM 44915]
MRMRDKVAVVTGAGRGNGRAIAERLAAEGAHVVLGDLLADEVTAVAREIEAAGGRATALRCDVSSPEEVEALVAAAEELGGPHAMVAQAGARHEGGLLATTPEQWDAYMAVDLKGTYLCARAAVPRMRRLGGGSIVTMSGTFAVVPEPGIAVQAAGKGAILALTRAIAVEHGPDNIRCNAIVPGYIETPMVERWANDHPDPAAARHAVRSMHALRRLGAPEEIAAMALFLCSDESSFSSGHPFPVDGGLSVGMNNIYEFEALRGNTGRGLDA